MVQEGKEGKIQHGSLRDLSFAPCCCRCILTSLWGGKARRGEHHGIPILDKEGGRRRKGLFTTSTISISLRHASKAILVNSNAFIHPKLESPCQKVATMGTLCPRSPSSSSQNSKIIELYVYIKIHPEYELVTY